MVVQLQTVSSNSASSILRRLTSTLNPFSKSRSHVILFSISPAPSLPADELSQLVSYFQTLRPERVGCLSAPIPLTTLAHGGYSNTFCSVAVFQSIHARSFRSTIPGKETPQVGRWHALRKKEKQPEKQHISGYEVDWEALWAQQTSKHALPHNLQDLRPESVNTVLYFTDDSPEGLSNSLAKYRHADKLGLVASSTPFVTGRPFTLFNNQEIASTGAVGVCLMHEAPTVSVEFPSLRAITGDLIVTSTEGNLIHSLDNKNPSRLLLSVIGDMNIDDTHAKDRTFHIDDTHAKDRTFHIASCSGKAVDQVYTVLSGDPSRGSIALEGESAPKEGSTVRIYYLPSTASKTVHPITSGNAGPILQLLTTGSESSFLWDGEMDGDAVVLPDRFYASSENGFVVSRRQGTERNEQPWRSTVLGGRIDLLMGA